MTKQRYAVFDFDGTISTLRCGWEDIMRPLMLEMIAPGGHYSEALVREVHEYIDQSTGIQTAYQMKWLAQRVKQTTGSSRDVWYYKERYNRRLLQMVEEKKRGLENGSGSAEDYLIAGSAAFLQALREKGFRLLLASGTDDADVKAEARLLGVAEYFESIQGAPTGSFDCSKERVLRTLMDQAEGARIVVFGDGKVEIALAKELGAAAVGIASDEEKRFGLDLRKKARLEQAGADVIFGDFTQPDALMNFVMRGA